MKLKIFSKRILIAITLIFLIGCDLCNKQKSFSLKVLVVSDPRFPNISREDYNNIFLTLPKIANKFFPLNIEKIQITEEISMSEFLNRYKDQKIKGGIDLFDNPEKIYKTQLTFLCEKEKGSIVKFLKLKEKNPKVITDYILKAYAKNLKIIKSATINKASIISKNSLENSYTFWENVIGKTSEYDIILINTLLMDDSANKDFPPSVHTLIRGGVTVGAALKSQAIHGGTIVFSLFPFVADIEPFNANENVPMRYKNTIIGYYLTHEIGHLFMYYPDDYKNSRCVMSPARDFRFLDWYLQVKDGYCKKPGRKTIQYIKSFYDK